LASLRRYKTRSMTEPVEPSRSPRRDGAVPTRGLRLRPAAPVWTPVGSSNAPAESDRSRSETVERNLAFNFSALLAHGIFGQTGFRLINAPTFLPQFVAELSGNASGAAVMRAIQSLGQFLSPLLAASLIEHRPHAKRLGVIFGAAMRVQILLLGLIALFVPRGDLALWLVWLCVGMFGLALGMQGVAFQVVMAKVIPLDRRGRLLGLRDATSGVVLIGVSMAGAFLLNGFGFQTGHGLTFLLAFGLTSLGLGAFASVREPAGANLRDRSSLLQRVRELPAVLRSDPNFGRFLAARILASAGRGALPLYVVWFERQFGITGTQLGTLTVLFSLAQSGATLAWGHIGDRRGYRQVFLLSTAAWLAGTGLLLLSPTVTSAFVTYGLVGAGLGGFMIAGQNLVLEFGTESDRAMRIATHNTTTEMFGMAGFLSAGLLADAISLETAFAASMGLQLLAIAAGFAMREPRTRSLTTAR